MESVTLISAVFGEEIGGIAREIPPDVDNVTTETPPLSAEEHTMLNERDSFARFFAVLIAARTIRTRVEESRARLRR